MATAKVLPARSCEQTYQFKALTDLWTGSVTFEEKNGLTKERPNHDRLVAAGLLGSIRWWLEVLVRGLDGSACDPTDTKCEDRNHCAVCELFGCTGWARKFRFEVLDEKGKIKTDQIKQGKPFSLRFIPLRPIHNEEWTLLDTTIRLTAEYGAIGGKTVFKPTDEASSASKLHHKDYGLVQMIQSQKSGRADHDDLKAYLSKWQKLNHGEFAWASLQHFWCVSGRHLERQDNNKSTFNQILGRQEVKKQSQDLASRNDKIAKWLAGSQQESKKVFSFKNPPRTFGFVKPELIDFRKMRERLQDVWGKDGWELLTGKKIIDRLFAEEGAHS